MRIGTRESALALWQANQVKALLHQNNTEGIIVPVSSDGDVDLVTPLYEMGVQGIFTRTLDIALLDNKIDVAVHSMKDVPTQLPKGIVQAAVLERGSWHDVVVYENNRTGFNYHEPMVIGTSSIRRKAQWQHRYKNASFQNLRGNMQTRLNKLYTSGWQGAIFAKAGLERIDLLPANHSVLDWMLPAPAQGAVVVVCRENDDKVRSQLQVINDEATAICTLIERSFLRSLLGGCSTPISALAEHHFNHISFTGNVCLPDGSELHEVSMTFNVNEAEDAGEIAAEKLLASASSAIKHYLKKD